MDDKDREYWFKYWTRGYFHASKMAEIARVLSLANQLQLNGCGFDLHIQQISPSLSGGITTPLTGLHLFENTFELLAILDMTVATLRVSMEHTADDIEES